MTESRGQNTTKIVIIVVAVIIVVCCIGGAGLAVLAAGKAATSFGPAREATEAFVGDLQRGDSAAAYGRLCAETRRTYTQEQFAEVAGKRRPVTSDIVGTSINNINGRTTATVTASLTYSDAFNERRTFRLEKEGGTWKICGRPY